MLLSVRKWFQSNQTLRNLKEYLEIYFDCEEFSHCDSMEEMFRLLKEEGRYDVFNTTFLDCMAERFKSKHIRLLLVQYQKKLEQFQEKTSLKEFEQAVRDSQQATHGLPIKIRLILAGRWPERTLKDLKGLVYDIFGVSAKTFVDILMRPGSIIVQWSAPLSVLPELLAKAKQATKLLIESDVQELTIGDECIFKVAVYTHY